MKNIFKKNICNNNFQLGLWSSLCSEVSADVIGGAGFDWILLDMEHSANDVRSVLSQAQAIESRGNSHVLVRPAWNDPVLINPLLDNGFNSFIIPMVNNEAEAKKAVSACLYPPKGIRGVAFIHRGNDYGREKDYLENIEKNICLIPQLETQQAISNCSSIMNVEGVTAIFIGPADLSADMGIMGEFDNKDLWKLIEKTVAEAKKAKKPIGTLIGRNDLVQRCIDLGFDFVGCGTDSTLLARAADDLKKSFKS
jgi:4-hydroxy-2-oxoheptanedioate aldolase